jgi:fibronectin type 3 domain-containing protein
MRAVPSTIRRFIAAAGLLACWQGTSLAQTDPVWGLPSPAPNATVNAKVAPVATKPVGVFRPDTDAPISLPPDMPPLHKMPPMALSEGGFRGGPQLQKGGRLITYHVDTGEVVESAASIVQPPPEHEGGGFTGLHAAEGGEDQQTNWGGVLSAVSDASLSTWPYRANCKLAMRFLRDDGTYSWSVCSGTMIDAETVLTAGHCIYTQGTGATARGWATEVYVFPGWDGSGDITPNAPDFPIPETIFNQWGFARGTALHSWTTWTDNADWDGDVGLVRVTRAVGMLTGWYGWNYGNSCATVQSRTYSNISYPAESCGGSLHTGAQMYIWDGNIDSCPDNQFFLATVPGCLTTAWGGMSGSSMYYISGADRFASAVASHGNRGDSTYYCRLFEDFVNNMNSSVIPTARGTSFDLQVLDCDLATTAYAAGGSVSGFSFIATNATNANPANQTFAYDIYLSSNTNISTSDTLLSQQNFTHDYAAMQSLRVNSAAFTIPRSVTPGTYYVGAHLDAGSGGDTDASNNDADTWDAVAITVSACVNPPAPTGVVSINFASCDRNTLTWNAATDASSYQVWRSTTNNSATATLRTTTTATSYDDLSVVSGTLYYYWVKAVYPCGTSGFSAVADGEINYIPAIPSGLSASDGTACNAVNLAWTAAARATSYRVYRNTTNSSATASSIGTTSATTFSDTTGVAGFTYYYFVRAENACGNSALSTVDTGRSVGSPGTPSGVGASTTNCNGVLVTWSAVSNASSYRVQRNTSNTPLGATTLAFANIGTSFLDTSAVTGTSYFYWIAANNACGTGSNSANLVRAGSRLGTLAAPTGVAAADNTVCTASINVTWTAVPNAATYIVSRFRAGVGPLETIASGIVGTSYTDSTVPAGSTYLYYVQSVNACGAVSALSAADAGTRGGPPLPVSGLTASDGTTCNSVAVSWTSSAGATAYTIRRGTSTTFGASSVIGTSTTTSFIDSTAVAGTFYFYWVIADSPCGSSQAAGPDRGNVGSGVSFTQQPVSATVQEGDPVSFSVVVGGATSYQWRLNGVNLVAGPRFSGITGPVLTINPSQLADAGVYTCRVTTACGSAISSGATLTVNPAPPCFADFNGDGGVDGDDVTAFFEAWEAGDASADTNLDGGVDGADADVFFSMWEAGGC